MNKNNKLIIKALYKLKTNSNKLIYNYARFGQPINTKLSEGILKLRNRSYSQKLNEPKYCCKRESGSENLKIF